MTTVARNRGRRAAGPPGAARPTRRATWLSQIQHPARLVVAALAATLVILALGAALDDAQLPGWALPGAVAAFVAYLAVVLPLRRLLARLGTRWRSECNAHTWARWLSHIFEVIGVLSRLAVPLGGLPIVLMLFAARGSANWLQSCLGAAAVVIALLIVHAEWPTLMRAKAWIGTQRGSRRSAGAVVATYIAVPLTVLFAASRESHIVHLINHIGGFVTWVALFAVAMWIIAGILRLGAFAASPVRLLGFIPLGISVTRGAMAVGIVPGERFARTIPVPGWFWIALFGTAVLSMIVANPLHRRTSWPTWRHVAIMIEALGFGAAFLASVLFFLAIVLALDASTTQGRSISKAVRPPERPGTPTWTQLPTTDQRLAEQFAPVLELHASEHWPLSSVDGYLRTVELTGRGLHRQHVTADTLPKTCGNSPAPCFTLRCRSDARPCDRGRPIGSGAGTGGIEYARVFRLSRRADAAAFIPPSPLGGQRIDAVIEYWLFYPYDRWEAETAFGVLTQQHGADWEVVIVGLSAQAPVFVAYSAHCAGTWYPWNEIAARTAVLFPGDEPGVALHPLVAVALGSHANYARAAERRASDWGSCADVSRKATAALTYTWNVRDRTSPDYELRPAHVTVVREDQGPTSFAGRWSASDTTMLQNARTRTLASGGGPTSPALKSLWTTPLWTIFRGGNWHRG